MKIRQTLLLGAIPAALLQGCASVPLEGNEKVVCYHPKAMGINAPYGQYALVAGNPLGAPAAAPLATPDPRRRLPATAVHGSTPERVVDSTSPDSQSGSLCFTLTAYSAQAAQSSGTCLAVRGPRGLLPVREGSSRFGVTWKEAGFRNPLWERALSAEQADAGNIRQRADALATQEDARSAIETRRSGLAQQGFTRRDECERDTKTTPTPPPRPVLAVDESARAGTARSLCADSWRSVFGGDARKLFSLARMDADWTAAAGTPRSTDLPKAVQGMLPAARLSPSDRGLLKGAISDSEADADIIDIFSRLQTRCVAGLGEAMKTGFQQWQERQRMAMAAPAERRSACLALFDGMDRDQARLDEATRQIERIDAERAASGRGPLAPGKPIDLRNLSCG